MLTLGTTENPKKHDYKYACATCDFTTSHLGDWTKHLATGKHIKLTKAYSGKHECACGKLFNHKQSLFRHKKICQSVNKPTAKNPKNPEGLPKVSHIHECECGRTYRHASSLSKHKKTCLQSVGDVTLQTTESEVLPQVLNALTGLKEDNDALKEEIKNLKSGVMTAVTEPKVINNNNNININIFLNDKCGDAIAIQDFAKTLMICMEDVNYALENGKVKGIENIIQKKFDELGVYKRPLHCTDVKRGTLYVKGEDGWEKEKGEMDQMIRDVECVQTTGIKVWGNANPEYSQGNQKLMEKWLRIVKCLTNSIDGAGLRKIEKRCQEMSKISQEEIG
jgi:hypothetical protein